jgi:hypothetical protein
VEGRREGWGVSIHTLRVTLPEWAIHQPFNPRP